MLVGRSIVLAHGVRADGSSLSAVVENSRPRRLIGGIHPLSAHCQRYLSKSGDLSPSTDWGSRSISRVNPYLATVVRFLGMLDKLGVTGSSPVPPTMKGPGNGAFRFFEAATERESASGLAGGSHRQRSAGAARPGPPRRSTTRSSSVPA
jgi:hypothetical protein